MEFLQERIHKARVLVVGDCMLDRYWFGSVDRISPEAPVPVVLVNKTEDRPGGAANVARNAAALGAKVSLLSVAGQDEAGEVLKTLLEKESIHTALHRDDNFHTTIKLRVVSRQQQLLRVDFETPPRHEILLNLLSDYISLVDQHDVIILSDYGKGGLTHIVKMIALARAAQKIILIDPKGKDYARYAGASFITPNRAELKEVVGAWEDESTLEQKAKKLRADLALQGILLTRSEEGMSLFTEHAVWSYPTEAQEVYDVSGAGDTVIATLGVMLASGCDLKTAIHIANQAAGVVVAKLGTAVVYPHEIPMLQSPV